MSDTNNTSGDLTRDLKKRYRGFNHTTNAHLSTQSQIGFSNPGINSTYVM